MEVAVLINFAIWTNIYEMVIHAYKSLNCKLRGLHQMLIVNVQAKPYKDMGSQP